MGVKQDLQAAFLPGGEIAAPTGMAFGISRFRAHRKSNWRGQVPHQERLYVPIYQWASRCCSSADHPPDVVCDRVYARVQRMLFAKGFPISPFCGDTSACQTALSAHRYQLDGQQEDTFLIAAALGGSVEVLEMIQSNNRYQTSAEVEQKCLIAAAIGGNAACVDFVSQKNRYQGSAEVSKTALTVACILEGGIEDRSAGDRSHGRLHIVGEGLAAAVKKDSRYQIEPDAAKVREYCAKGLDY